MGFPRGGGGLKRVATTGDAGFALENGTPTIVEWTAPDDGKLHSAIITGSVNVTAAETGGQVIAELVIGGSASAGQQLNGGGETGTGFYPPSSPIVFTVRAGDTIRLVQSSALTAGAALVYAEIWAN